MEWIEMKWCMIWVRIGLKFVCGLNGRKVHPSKGSSEWGKWIVGRKNICFHLPFVSLDIHLIQANIMLHLINDIKHALNIAHHLTNNTRIRHGTNKNVSLNAKIFNFNSNDFSIKSAHKRPQLNCFFLLDAAVAPKWQRNPHSFSYSESFFVHVSFLHFGASAVE